jgi:Uma2 family endonuclease
MAVHPHRRFTAAEYLEMERAANYRSEFVNGEIYAMSGASREHNLITVNISRELSQQLKGRPCETYSADMRVKVLDTGMYAYPDVVVVCGDPAFEDAHVDTLTNPTVLIEVLSPSTEAYDRGAKFSHYRRLSSLREYLLVACDRFSVVRYTKDHDRWIFAEVNAEDEVITLAAIGCTLSLREIYDRVRFPVPDAGNTE